LNRQLKYCRVKNAILADKAFSVQSPNKGHTFFSLGWD
jgi:hypothetical protein